MSKAYWLNLADRFKETWFSRFFRSVKVAIWIISLVVLASILGTIFIQNGQPNDYIQKYGETGFFWIRLLGLNDVYHVWWYKLLLVVLTMATVTCIGSRMNMKLVRSGSLFVHINIVTILVGIVIGRFGDKGFLQVFEGEKNNQMIVEKGFEKNPQTGEVERKVEMQPLPFEVALNDFYITRYEKPNERLFVLDEKGKVVKSFPVEPGKLVKMPKQRMGLTVLETYPDARFEETVVHDHSEGALPAVNLVVDSPQGRGEGWLFSHSSDFLFSPDKTMLVYFRWYDSEKEMNEAIKAFEQKTDDPRHRIPHIFQVVNGKDLQPRILHFEKGKFVENHLWEAGKPVEFESVKTTFTPTQFLEQARIQSKITNESQEFNNPALRLAIGTPESGIQTRWIFANQRDPHSSREIPYQFYYSVDFPVKEYVSNIKILDGGKEVMRKSLRVNHPAKYKGYWLYQASYDKQNEKWTGIQVTRDPGLKLVLIGFVGMMIGLIQMFYINPWLKKGEEPENEEIAV